MSEPEPELGLGTVDSVDGYQVAIDFPASGERRIYAVGATVLKRVAFRAGERVNDRSGQSFSIEEIEERDGLLVYRGEGLEAREDELSDASSFSHPQDRLMSGKVDDGKAFDLRYRALLMQHAMRGSELRGFLGGRVDLIPHQYYILHEVSSRQLPRVLLSDEVGLGKTIEACLIMQRLRAVGRAQRILVLVPEPLVHQWFVELMRRFNLWFSIFDEERCLALEASNDGANPFLDEQMVLCGVSFLAGDDKRGAQAIEAGWDLVVVDEAHHLEWSPEGSNREYDLVETLGRDSEGLLLLTATPTQLGLAGHFARLRLLDPDRYSNLEAFRAETEEFGTVASVAGKIVDHENLNTEDVAQLGRIFHRDAEGLKKRLDAFKRGRPGARETLLQALLDEHGTGRVVFRNSRTNMKGFPKRMYCPAPLRNEGNRTLLKKLQRELEAESEDREAEIRYQFKGDPRLAWLVSFLKARKGEKALLICKSRPKALAIEAALREALNVKMALFHEDLVLVQRDRNAAWFAEEDGAQILICSEIGSEGRNFQFAHHLILFDLPINPGLLEQRIGRLDRIGQTQPIQIHVPYVLGSPQEMVAEWCHQGLDAFQSCVHGGAEYLERFGGKLLELAQQYGASLDTNHDLIEAFVKETQDFRAEISERLRKGRDRLLELNSFDVKVASEVISKVKEAESDHSLRSFVFELLEQFGVRIDEQEDGDVVLDASHAYVEAFPSLPKGPSLATFDRARAISREDAMFITPDHSIVSDAIDLLVNSEQGTSGFCILKSNTQNILLEVVFVLETVSLSRLHVDRYLPPSPVRTLVDLRGRDLTEERSAEWIQQKVVDGHVNRFLERPGFTREFMDAMLGGAEALAEGRAKRLRAKARKEARTALKGEIERLIDLKKINDNVREDEIKGARAELEGVLEAIDEARLRLDSLRLIVEGDGEGLEKG